MVSSLRGRSRIKLPRNLGVLLLLVRSKSLPSLRLRFKCCLWRWWSSVVVRVLLSLLRMLTVLSLSLLIVITSIVIASVVFLFVSISISSSAGLPHLDISRSLSPCRLVPAQMTFNHSGWSRIVIGTSHRKRTRSGIGGTGIGRRGLILKHDRVANVVCTVESAFRALFEFAALDIRCLIRYELGRQWGQRTDHNVRSGCSDDYDTC
jgi:hypothetical protein